MEIGVAIPVIILSYLIGSISFSRVVTRFLKPEADLENVVLKTEEGQPGARLRTLGATTASIEVGSRWGCFIAWLDIFKVAIPSLITRLMFPDQPYLLLAAVFGMIGHNWPIYYKFKGGTGMSSIYGGLIVIDFIGAIVCSLAGLVFGLVIVKDVLVAYLSGIWFLVPWLWFRTQDPAYLLYAIAINILIILALIPEIRDQIKTRREGKQDMAATMDSFPMGKGMLKIMKRLGLTKK